MDGALQGSKQDRELETWLACNGQGNALYRSLSLVADVVPVRMERSICLCTGLQNRREQRRERCCLWSSGMVAKDLVSVD